MILQLIYHRNNLTAMKNIPYCLVELRSHGNRGIWPLGIEGRSAFLTNGSKKG